MQLLRKLMTDSAGGTAVEYGLVIGLITMTIFAAVIGLGSGVSDSYTDTAQKVAAATPSS